MANDEQVRRRSFLGGAATGAAAATLPIGATQLAQAQPQPPAALPPAAAQPAPDAAPGYMYLRPDEAAFVEALADTMIPADALSPKGTDIGINSFIDRALASGWGRGDRLYMQGPWQLGTPNQGYQLPLTPAALYRAGIEATNAHCVATYGKPFDGISEAQRNEVLTGLDRGTLQFASGLPARAFWTMVYENVMEGMFADPIYGGNRDKAGWKMIGFPGVVQNNRNNVAAYRNKRYVTDPMSISDMS